MFAYRIENAYARTQQPYHVHGRLGSAGPGAGARQHLCAYAVHRVRKGRRVARYPGALHRPGGPYQRGDPGGSGGVPDLPGRLQCA